MPEVHPATAAILRYFEADHLPPHLRQVAVPFGVLARQLADTLPAGPELTVALRKLLEAKDRAVRAALELPDRPVTFSAGSTGG